MRNLIEICNYRKGSSFYILATSSSKKAEEFFDNVKRATPKNYKCVLYPLSGGFIIDYLSSGNVKGVKYIREYENI